MCMLSSQTSSPPTPRAQIVPAPTSKNLPINQEPSFIRRDDDMDAPSQVGHGLLPCERGLAAAARWLATSCATVRCCCCAARQPPNQPRCVPQEPTMKYDAAGDKSNDGAPTGAIMV